LCWERAVVTPVLDKAGAITHFVALKEDITRQRQLEDELRQTQKMEAFGQLASGVAHDFNNILTVIRGNADLLQPPGGAPTRQDGPLGQIFSAVEVATRLTRQMLLFSRRQTAQKREIDLNAVVVDMSDMLRRMIGEHVTLEARLAPGVLTVQADLGMIEQVLMNLAVNARDAMPNGGRLVMETIVVEGGATGQASHRGVGAGEYVRLTVRDTGCGVDPADLPHIFEPFFTTKGTGRGTGLGLATVHEIVRQHGGWVDVDTKPEVGTAFQVYLPRSNGRVGERVERRRADDEPRGAETVLIVEDEPSVRRLLRTVLEHHGYQVLEATSGVNALEVWSGHREEIDLLVTDIVLPGGLSGWELGQRLLREKPKLKVLHTSGYSDEMLGEAVALRGTPNLLEKPYGPIELLRRVRACLEAK
jgi:signal transduction histidine kinase